MAKEKSDFSLKCITIMGLLVLIVLSLLFYTHYRLYTTHKKIDEIEFKDSTNTYNKIYYETTINNLKKKNRELYDSLEASKDKIDYLVQFTATHNYHTGQVPVKPNGNTIETDTVGNEVYATYEYSNTIKNDTMEYKLKVNTTHEPRWYSLDVRTTNKYTIVNREYADGMNHVTIGDGTHTGEITDVTVFKKKKRTFWDRFSFGPSVTAGYDVVNKQFGIMVGGSVTFDLK